MRRREFITLLGGAAVWPVAARAQQPKLPLIGYLGATTAVAEKSRTDAFVKRLRELGRVEGRTIAIEYRWGEGRNDRYAEIAAEFIRLNVDLIFASGTGAALLSKQATSVVPIVFGLAGDPLGTGLVESLARPGNNVTGLSNQAADLGGKRLELLRELIPGLSRLAILANANYPGGKSEIGEIDVSARTLGLEVARYVVREPKEITLAFDAMKGQAQALYVVGDTFMNSNRVRVTTMASAAHLPAMYVHRDYVEAGGLISYGANIEDLFRRGADFVDKILRGAKPSDLPVEQPTKFELVINITTAKAVGIEVPPPLLVRADEVIE